MTDSTTTTTNDTTWTCMDCGSSTWTDMDGNNQCNCGGSNWT